MSGTPEAIMKKFIYVCNEKHYVNDQIFISFR